MSGAASEIINVAVETLPTNFDLSVVLGEIPGVEGFIRSAYNLDIVATDEDLWNVSSSWVPLSAAVSLEVLSDDANDTLAGTGAQTVFVEGLDGSYAEISETINMNGIAVVNTVNSYLRVQNITVATAGSSGVNEGIITIRDAVNVQNQITEGENGSAAAQFTVPADKQMFIRSATFSALSADQTFAQIITRPEGGIFTPIAFKVIAVGGLQINILKLIDEKTDFRILVRRETGAGDNMISCFYNFYLVDK